MKLRKYIILLASLLIWNQSSMAGVYQTLSIPSSGQLTSFNPPQAGQYDITISGTFQYDDRVVGGRRADAIWRYQDPTHEVPYLPVWDSWIFVNGSTISAPYKENHTYAITVDTDGSPITFQIYDSYYGGNSGSLSVTIEARPLDVPPNFKAEYGADDHSIKLSWDPVDGATEYRLYRNRKIISSFGAGTLVATLTSETEYIDTIPENDSTRLLSYRIVAANAANESDYKAKKAEITAQTRFRQKGEERFDIFWSELFKHGIKGDEPVSSVIDSILQAIEDRIPEDSMLADILYGECGGTNEFGQVITCFCPVDVRITTSGGDVITKTNANEFGIFYIEGDLMGSGETNDVIILPPGFLEEYNIDVVPNNGLTSADYSAYVGSSSGVITLASNATTTASAPDQFILSTPTELFLEHTTNSTCEIKWEQASANIDCILQVSTNLLDWETVSHNYSQYRSQGWYETSLTNSKAMFFRVVNTSTNYHGAE